MAVIASVVRDLSGGAGSGAETGMEGEEGSAAESGAASTARDFGEASATEGASEASAPGGFSVATAVTASSWEDRVLASFGGGVTPAGDLCMSRAFSTAGAMRIDAAEVAVEPVSGTVEDLAAVGSAVPD